MRDRSLADRLAREAQRPSYSDRQVKNVDLLDFLVRTSPSRVSATPSRLASGTYAPVKGA